MKTAISVPDDTFEEATRQAHKMGMSRSEFFSRAARKYLDDLSRESLTHQIDQALDLAGDDDSAAVAADVGRHRVSTEADW